MKTKKMLKTLYKRCALLLLARRLASAFQIKTFHKIFFKKYKHQHIFYAIEVKTTIVSVIYIHISMTLLGVLDLNSVREGSLDIPYIHKMAKLH